MHWSEGYHVGDSYLDGYYAELSPSRIDTALALVGYRQLPAGPYCELGFGRGTSLVLHAAAHPERAFFGNDFLPAHVSEAAQLAQAAGVAVHLSDSSFEDYCADESLPQFAVIVAHGVWSWVSAENRARIVDFVRRKLLPGGVFHISYNLKSGWLGTEPLRELLYLHYGRMQAPSAPTEEKIAAALEFAEALMALNPAAAAAAPAMKARFEHLRTQGAQYLAHEYFNAEWHLTSFAEVSSQLQHAKLSYATSAMLSDHIHEIQVSAEQLAQLQAIRDPLLRTAAWDLCSGQAFRRDLWVKGPQLLDRVEFDCQWREWLLLPIAQRRKGQPVTVKGWAGEAQLPLDSTEGILDYLHGAAGLRSVQDLIDELKVPQAQLPQLRKVLRLLMAAGHIDLARAPAMAAASAAACKAANHALSRRASAARRPTPQMSPVTGVGINFPPALIAALQTDPLSAARPANEDHSSGEPGSSDRAKNADQAQVSNELRGLLAKQGFE